jgi:DNA-3-methyladenine glycosylase
LSLANPSANTLIQDLPVLPVAFLSRRGQEVASELIGCLLVKRQADGEQLPGVLVETEAYSHEEPACRGYRNRSSQNEILLGESGAFICLVRYGSTTV